MAAEEKQRVYDALETLVSITEKSGNLRKDLKNNIHVSVSTLRKVFSHLINEINNVKEEYNSYREEVKNATKDVAGGHSQTTRQVTQSSDHTQQSQSTGARQIMTSGGGRRKLFSEIVKNQDNNKRYRITLESKEETITPEQIKTQLKKNTNPTDIKVGIKAVKTIRDRGLLIETDSEEERNILSTDISSKLGEKLYIIQHKLRKPRLIMYSVPEEITVENIEAIIRAQNPEVITNKENLEAKYRYKNKRGR